MTTERAGPLRPGRDQKLAHFSSPLADEGDHVDIGDRIAGDHPEQRRFSDARSGENAHALPFSDRQNAVDARTPTASGSSISCRLRGSGGDSMTG